jgi:hypothetical protein
MGIILYTTLVSLFEIRRLLLHCLQCHQSNVIQCVCIIIHSNCNLRLSVTRLHARCTLVLDKGVHCKQVLRFYSTISYLLSSAADSDYCPCMSKDLCFVSQVTAFSYYSQMNW